MLRTHSWWRPQELVQICYDQIMIGYNVYIIVADNRGSLLPCWREVLRRPVVGRQEQGTRCLLSVWRRYRAPPCRAWSVPVPACPRTSLRRGLPQVRSPTRGRPISPVQVAGCPPRRVCGCLPGTGVLYRHAKLVYAMGMLSHEPAGLTRRDPTPTRGLRPHYSRSPSTRSPDSSYRGATGEDPMDPSFRPAPTTGATKCLFVASGLRKDDRIISGHGEENGPKAANSVRG
jgi:hypothetical protein